MRVTKDVAKQQVSVYGQLLADHAVIGDIVSSERQGELLYSFDVYAKDYTFPVECLGVKQLALVLSTMWYAYEKAHSLLAFEV